LIGSDETNGVNNAVSRYKEAVPFSASLLTLLFASFKQICGTTINFVSVHRGNTNFIANTPLDRSAALVLTD